MIRRSPQTRFMMIAVWSGKSRIGIKKVRAVISFVRKVGMVACHTWE